MDEITNFASIRIRKPTNFNSIKIIKGKMENNSMLSSSEAEKRRNQGLEYVEKTRS